MCRNLFVEIAQLTRTRICLVVQDLWNFIIKKFAQIKNIRKIF